MDQLTMELKSISVQELDGEHAKDLIERRDLEDILYSSSAAVWASYMVMTMMLSQPNL